MRDTKMRRYRALAITARLFEALTPFTPTDIDRRNYRPFRLASASAMKPTLRRLFVAMMSFDAGHDAADIISQIFLLTQPIFAEATTISLERFS